MNEWGDNCYPSIARICYETGLSKPTVIKYLQSLKDEGWLTAKKKGFDGQAWAHNQYYPNVPEKAVKDVNHLTEGGKAPLPRRLSSLTKAVKEVNTSSTVNSTVSSIERGRFTPPTVSEVGEYVKEKGVSIDPEYFVSFYESKGWMVGKNKMKSWKHAITTWAKRDEGNRKTSTDIFEAGTSDAYD